MNTIWNYFFGSENIESNYSKNYKIIVKEYIKSKNIIISEHYLEYFMNVLEQVIEYFEKYPKYKIANYKYITYQIVYQIKNNYKIRIYFVINQTNIKIKKYDELWKKICNDLNLKYKSIYQSEHDSLGIMLRIHKIIKHFDIEFNEYEFSMFLEMFYDVYNYFPNYDCLVCRLFEFICPNKNRFNYTPDFDEQWKNICLKMNWKFISTYNIDPKLKRQLEVVI